MAGGLGGLGGYINSPQGGNMLQALGMSLMSSPRNAPLSNFGQYYTGLQTQQMRRDALDQDRADTMASRDAMAQALISAGVSEPEAKTLSINPAAAKVRLEQISKDQAKAANDQWMSGISGLLGGTETPPPSPESAVAYPGVSDASSDQPAPERPQMPQEYGGASVFSERGAAQPAGFTVGGPIADTGYLEAVPAPGPGAEIPLSDVSKDKQNKTVAWLQENDPEAAALIDQGFSPKDALDIAMVRQKSRKPAQEGTTQVAQAQTPQPSNLDQLYRNRDAIAQYLAKAPSKEAFDRGKMYLDIYDKQIERAQKQGGVYEERAAAARQYGLDPNSDEFRNFILSGKLPDPPSARDQFGLNPIYGKDKDGNLIVMQPSKSGGLVTAELPEGVTLQPGTGKIDLGTEWGITDRSGMIIQRIPKDLAGAEAQKAEGKSRGEASFDLPRVEQNAEQTLGILERMKTHPGREGSTGFVQGILPSRTSEQVDFQSLVDQTQGQSFLQAFQMLKGAGQITEIEGQKATVAISRLGNQRLSDADYLKAITDLEEVVKKGLARAKKQAGQSGQDETETSAPAATGSGLKWSIEE